MREAAGHQPPPLTGTRTHLNGVGPRVEVEGPRGVAIAAVRGGGGGVAVGAPMAATTTGYAVVVSPSSAQWLSPVVIIGHRRRWRGTPRGGVACQGGNVVEGGWGGRSLGFESSGSEKKRSLSSNYHAIRHLLCQSNHKTQVI
jgi:hypothetical protein